MSVAADVVAKAAAEVAPKIIETAAPVVEEAVAPIVKGVGPRVANFFKNVFGRGEKAEASAAKLGEKAATAAGKATKGSKLLSIAKKLGGAAGLAGLGAGLLGGGSNDGGSATTRNPGARTPGGNNVHMGSPSDAGNEVPVPHTVGDIGLGTESDLGESGEGSNLSGKKGILDVLYRILAEQKKTTMGLNRGFTSLNRSLYNMDASMQRSQILNKLAIDAKSGESGGRGNGGGHGGSSDVGGTIASVSKGLLLAAGLGAAMGVVQAFTGGNDSTPTPPDPKKPEEDRGYHVPKHDPSTRKKDEFDKYRLTDKQASTSVFGFGADAQTKFFGEPAYGAKKAEVDAIEKRNKNVGRSAYNGILAALPLPNSTIEGMAKSKNIVSRAARWLTKEATLNIPMTNSFRQRISDNEDPSNKSKSKNNKSSGSLEERKKIAMDYFKSQGWTEAQATGIVVNLVEESKLDPNPKGYNDGGKAYGIGQWHADRQALFEKSQHKPIQGSSLQDQLKFVQWELTHSEKGAGDSLKNEDSASDAAFVVSKQYERPGNTPEARESAAVNRSILARTFTVDDSLKPSDPTAPDLADAANSKSNKTASVSNVNASNQNTNIKNTANITPSRGSAVADVKLRGNVTPSIG